MHVPTLSWGQQVGQGGTGRVFPCVFAKNALGVAKAAASRIVDREALLLSQRNHPNIVAFCGVCLADSCLYMERLWVDLSEASCRFTFPESVAKSLMKQVLLVVEFMHSRGFVHRDLKPSNVMISEEVHKPRLSMEVEIVDLGSACVLHAGDKLFSGVGIFAYIAPGMFIGGRGYTSAVDIFSSALVGFELLGGQAFWGNARMDQHLQIDDLLRNYIPIAISRRAREPQRRCAPIEPGLNMRAARALEKWRCSLHASGLRLQTCRWHRHVDSSSRRIARSF